MNATTRYIVSAEKRRESTLPNKGRRSAGERQTRGQGGVVKVATGDAAGPGSGQLDGDGPAQRESRGWRLIDQLRRCLRFR